MVSASYGAIPIYAAYYRNELSAIQMQKAYQNMSADDKVLYSDELAKRYQGKCYEQ